MNVSLIEFLDNPESQEVRGYSGASIVEGVAQWSWDAATVLVIPLHRIKSISSSREEA